MKALFGPAGNPQLFYDAGGKHTYEIAAWLRQYGLDAYEYSAGRGVNGSIETFLKIGEEARKYGIRTSFHAPYFISLSGEKEETRLRSIDYIRQSMEAALAMGADTVVIHTGSVGKRQREQALALARDTLLRALDEIPDNGVHMGLETMGKVGQLGTLDEVIGLCSSHERLYPVVDFGHLNARELGGVFLTADDYRRVFDKIGEALGEQKARYLHMICESAGTQAEDALFMKRCTYGEEN